jgi:hypothetical protein
MIHSSRLDSGGSDGMKGPKPSLGRFKVGVVAHIQFHISISQFGNVAAGI